MTPEDLDHIKRDAVSTFEKHFEQLTARHEQSLRSKGIVGEKLSVERAGWRVLGATQRRLMLERVTVAFLAEQAGARPHDGGGALGNVYAR